jgi:hypothetical protein
VSALYWRGRALELAKKSREAADAYRTILQTAPDQNYYWFRARERLGVCQTAASAAAADGEPANERRRAVPSGQEGYTLPFGAGV